MKFVVFSHAEHYLQEGRLFSYGPYVREMNLWISTFEEVEVVAPFSRKNFRLPSICLISHSNISLKPIPFLHYKKSSFFKNLSNSLKIVYRCYQEMKNADHIHLRCPGNVGMLAMMVSSLFPSTPKSVKYAGNWDPKSEQPLSYRFQKWWLSNTFLTRNAKVLVYGKWEGQSKNIIPFFTASFSASEIERVEKDFKAPFRFLFCGSLSEGKQPLFAVELIHQLSNAGAEVRLDIYGEGPERKRLVRYIEKYELNGIVKLYGNQPQGVLKEAYRKAHFCLLPSKSEGWPKALAEGMFFGCIPVGTEISCVPWMLGAGSRGILLPPPTPIPPPTPPGPLHTSPKRGRSMGGRVQEAVGRICSLMRDEEKMRRMSVMAREWSQEYTLEKFRDEIHKLL